MNPDKCSYTEKIMTKKADWTIRKLQIECVIADTYQSTLSRDTKKLGGYTPCSEWVVS